MTTKSTPEEIKVPLTKEQLQQLHYATRSHQTELMTVAAQFLAHYADVLPMNSPVTVEALECALALMDLDTIEVRRFFSHFDGYNDCKMVVITPLKSF